MDYIYGCMCLTIYHIRCMDECTVSTQMTGAHISENYTAVPRGPYSWASLVAFMMAVCNRWTGLLDWNTGMDYSNDLWPQFQYNIVSCCSTNNKQYS